MWFSCHSPAAWSGWITYVIDRKTIDLPHCSPRLNSLGVGSHWVTCSSWDFVISGQVRTHWHGHDPWSELTPQQCDDWLPTTVTERVDPVFPPSTSLPLQTVAAHYVQHTVEHRRTTQLSGLKCPIRYRWIEAVHSRFRYSQHFYPTRPGSNILNPRQC